MAKEIVVSIDSGIDLLKLNGHMKSIDESLVNLAGSESIIFDISRCTFLSAAAVVFLVMLRDEVADIGCRTFLRCPRSSKVLQFLKATRAIEMGDSNAYIDALRKYTIELRRCMTYTDAANLIQGLTSWVRKHGGTQESTTAAADYLMNELVDNAGTHGYKCYTRTAYPRPIYIAAYVYQQYFEIAIADRGQGICKSLKDKDVKYRKMKDDDVLRLAIDNGVSGHPTGSPGFGLYVTSEVVKGNRGILKIWSSRRLLEHSATITNTRRGYLRMGTLVGLRLDRTRESPIDAVINTGTVIERRSAKDYLDEMQELDFNES